MGDRTSVTITVRRKDYMRLLAKDGGTEPDFPDAIGADNIDDDGDWVTIEDMRSTTPIGASCKTSSKKTSFLMTRHGMPAAATAQAKAMSAS